MSATRNSDSKIPRSSKRTERVYFRHMFFTDSIEKYFHNTFYSFFSASKQFSLLKKCYSQTIL